MQLFSSVARLSGVELWLDLEVQHPGKLLSQAAGRCPTTHDPGRSSNPILAVQLKGLCNRRSTSLLTAPTTLIFALGVSAAYVRWLGEGEPLLRSISFLQLVAGSGTREFSADVRLSAEKCTWDFLRLAWRRRDAVWSQVTVPGNQWRLPAPR